MGKSPNLDAAYALGAQDDHRRLYDDWAETYDATFVQGHQYAMPEHLARAALALPARGLALDVGVGTGAVGEHLSGRWTGGLHGLDLSPEMLRIAEQKGLYADLMQADLLKPLPLADHTYDLIISAGTFTLGHLGPDPLPELLRITKPGGWFVLGINQMHYHAAGFQSAFDTLSADISGLTLSACRLYHQGATGDHADDLGWIVQFQKRR